nr:formylglycine-generating enzyme family protein [Leptospira ryugenii]
MSCIPKGEFIRGSNQFEVNERPQATIYLDDYFMDVYEVTNRDFNSCLKAGYCSACLKDHKCDYIGPRYGKIYMRDEQPIVGVSWYTAKEYCRWKGKRLPTESEWEKASRGPSGDLYPWGSSPANCQNAIIEENGHKGCFKEISLKPHQMTTQAVGSREAGHYGLYDMAGNSWEWVEDWYSESYEKCGGACFGKNPKGPCNGKEECPGHSKKIVKGGSWWWPGNMARGSYRRSHIPENFPEYHHFGFRCAKDVP